MNNYPDNVDPRSPDCPWNQKDPVMMTCDECNGSGEIIDDDGNHDCIECNGNGEIQTEDED